MLAKQPFLPAKRGSKTLGNIETAVFKEFDCLFNKKIPAYAIAGTGPGILPDQMEPLFTVIAPLNIFAAQIMLS